MCALIKAKGGKNLKLKLKEPGCFSVATEFLQKLSPLLILLALLIGLYRDFE